MFREKEMLILENYNTILNLINTLNTINISYNIVFECRIKNNNNYTLKIRKHIKNNWWERYNFHTTLNNHVEISTSLFSDYEFRKIELYLDSDRIQYSTDSFPTNDYIELKIFNIKLFLYQKILENIPIKYIFTNESFSNLNSKYANRLVGLNEFTSSKQKPKSKIIYETADFPF